MREPNEETKGRRPRPARHAFVTQQAEYRSLKPGHAGSKPAGCTNKGTYSKYFGNTLSVFGAGSTPAQARSLPAKQRALSMAPWSNGSDAGPSARKCGFESHGSWPAVKSACSSSFCTIQLRSIAKGSRRFDGIPLQTYSTERRDRHAADFEEPYQ